jgi:hypothetical protein
MAFRHLATGFSLFLWFAGAAGEAVAASSTSTNPMPRSGGTSSSVSSSSSSPKALAQVPSRVQSSSTLATTSTASLGREVKTTSTGDSRLYAPKRAGESDQAFFQRAARELGQKATGSNGQLSPSGRAALDRLARGAGYNAVRGVVTSGGVVGSASGNSYVTYYRSGWDQANLTPRAPAPANNGASAASSNARASAPPPGARKDPALEKSVRAMLAQSDAGRRALGQLRAAGISIRFRQGGGTFNDAASRSIVVDTKMGNGQDKPTSWLAVSTAHEASHSWDDKTKQTPSTVSPTAAQYGAGNNQWRVPMQVWKELHAERQNYVTRQVAGEARAMTAEVRVRRELEQKNVDFHRLDNKLLDAYNQGHDGVYRAAGVKPPDGKQD